MTSLVLGLTATVDTPPAYAYFKHTHKHMVHKAKKKTKTKVKKSKINTMLRDAQTSLINLDYTPGQPDGLLGPKTVAAIKAFQRDHHLKATGKLTHETYNAIIKADKTRAMSSLPNVPTPLIPVPASDTLPTQPGLTGTTNQQYADPLLGGQTVAGSSSSGQAVRTQELSSRFAKLDINENLNGNTRRYNLTLNGEPILQIDNQPSIIGMSPSYKLSNEDAVILTTYVQDDNVCPYKQYLLTLSQSKNELRAFGNCTQGYQARVVQDSLFVTFPEIDDQRVAGATWRYEEGFLEKL
jgi:hypothetical protein